jgi:hypothetical protein
MIVPWIRSGYRWPGWVPAAGYAVVLALWLAIHPGIRMFGTRQAEASSADYIGVYAGTALTKVLASLRTVLNLAPSGRAPVWPDDLSVVFVLALGLLAAAFWIFSRRRWLSEPLPMSMPWVVAIGTYTVVVPAVATAVFVRQWSPYYLCVSAMGVAILVGAALRRSGWRLAATVAMVWLTIGVWSRGDRSMSPTVSTERTFATSGQELKVVEQGFRQLRPSFPSNSRIYVSIMGLRLGDVRNALERYQCLRVWYQDPSLRTADPLNPIQGNGPEFQFVVRKGPVVDEVVFHEGNAGNPSSIDVVLGAPSSSTLGVALAIRNRAMGLATVGDVDRAVEMLLSLPIPAYRTFHWRLAGVFLLAAGRAAEAEALVARSPMQSPGDAASYLYLYFIHTQGSRFDDAAFPCFGVSPRDAGTLRSLRIRLEEEGYVDGALRCARRLAALLPESSEARADVERLERAPENDRVTRRADE